MVTGPGMTSPLLVGRSEELGILGALLDRAHAGESGALIVFGDAGVGKTTLVRQACASLSPPGTVLYGAALPLASMTVPFLALRAAVRTTSAEGGEALFVAEPSASNVPVAFDGWLDGLCRDSTVVLAIDDLQWADQSTLDVLMYVLAGPANRRLAVIATVRSDEVGADHPLQRWLADTRRMPRVEQLELGPLDRVGTEAQLTSLIGVPHQSLVEDVFTHTRGNPYLNRLAVAGVTPAARHLPAELPADLKSAVLQSARRLSDPARTLARVLAVGGRPLHAAELAVVVGAGAGAVSDLLREGVQNGILDIEPTGAYWFHHPMNAEVLEHGLPEEERQRLHAAFADYYENRLVHTPVPSVELMVALADHHYRAGHSMEAYRWALDASAGAGRAGGSTEMLRLLTRAVALRDQLPGAVESRLDLLHRLRSAAAEAGQYEEELEAIESLLASLDHSAEPLMAAELLVRRTHLRFSTGQAFFTPNELREAVRLASVDPHSWQYALALAEVAHAEFWEDSPDAAPDADRAIALAREAGNPRALSYALTTKSVVAVLQSRGEEGRVFATEAEAAALQAEDYWAFCHAVNWEANAVEVAFSRLYATIFRRRRETLVALEAPHPYIALLSANEASSLLFVGDWRECLNRLRVVLGSDPGPFADVHARLTAARLAAWQGRPTEAEAHLARADEILAGSTAFLNFPIDAVRAEVCLAAGKPEAAFNTAMAGATSPGVPPTMCEWLMPLAARAIADQVQQVRDAGTDPSSLLARLDDLLDRFPSVLRDIGESTELWERQVEALNAVYAAEAGRARQDPDNGDKWVEAAEACDAATLAWEELYGFWRAAESLLIRDRHHREQGASVLRKALDLADLLGADAIKAALEDLSVSARIHVEKVGSQPNPEAWSALVGLTEREREILDHVVAGRTYGEIARALVISEKTVSSHISNLLRKTGTSNRVDLSRLAMSAIRSGPT